MQTFNIPTNLNGAELRDELRAAGVMIADFPAGIRCDETFIYLDISEEDSVKAASVIEAHNGTTVISIPTPAEKLAVAGLTVEELKAVLGIN